MEDKTKKTEGALAQTHPEDDGRNKEWQDRARVNLEEVPEGTKTNLERDFEPEDISTRNEGKEGNAPDPVY